MPRRGTRSPHAFDNMDEILTLRSQASEGGRSVRSADNSVREDGRVALVNGGRITRRHSAVGRARRGRDSGDSSESESAVSENVLDHRVSVVRLPSSPRSASSPRRGFLGCLGCFTTPKRPTPSPHTSPRRSLTPGNPACAEIARTLQLLSESTEIETADAADVRLVFLLFAAFSGEPILDPQEYADCDEWIDWLSLGFSADGLDAFERDVNRLGSQALGMLLMLFFSTTYTESARLCVLIIRNVHFDPSALFGLFAINCCKWTRDVILDSMHLANPVAPLVFSSAQKVIAGGSTAAFLHCLDWWLSEGAVGELAEVEARFTDHEGSRGAYDEFEEESEGGAGSGGSGEGGRGATSAETLRRRVSHATISGLSGRVPDLNLRSPEELKIFRETLVVAGLYYSNCVLGFAKFWLEKDLLAVNTDVARERLNNAYLDKEFVSKLKFSASISAADLAKRNAALAAKVDQLWKASGWRKEDLLRRRDSEEEE